MRRDLQALHSPFALSLPLARVFTCPSRSGRRFSQPLAGRQACRRGRHPALAGRAPSKTARAESAARVLSSGDATLRVAARRARSSHRDVGRAFHCAHPDRRAQRPHRPDVEQACIATVVPRAEATHTAGARLRCTAADRRRAPVAQSLRPPRLAHGAPHREASSRRDLVCTTRPSAEAPEVGRA